MNTGATTNTDDNRTIPAAMLELTRLALAHGIDTVSLGFASDGFEYNAPHGWTLHLTKREEAFLYNSSDTASFDDNDKHNHLSITASIANPQPTAYTGWYNWDDMRNNISMAAIVEWITMADTLVATPSADEQAVLVGDITLMEEAINNGWAIRRELKRDVQLYISKHLLADKQPRPLSASFVAECMNWHYNEEGHPAHRDTGAELTTRLWCMRNDVMKPEWDSALLDGVRISIDTVTTMMTSPAPWTVRVARFQESDNEEFGVWVN